MAVRSKVGVSAKKQIEPVQKKTRQGNSHLTKLSASSRNGRKKKYRGQGK